MVSSKPMTIREFSRQVLPLYRRERWTWRFRVRIEAPKRVPTELDIAMFILSLMFHRRVLPIGRSTSSGGLIVTRHSGKTFLIEMMPRCWFRPCSETYNPLIRPLLSAMVTL